MLGCSFTRRASALLGSVLPLLLTACFDRTTGIVTRLDLPAAAAAELIVPRAFTDAWQLNDIASRSGGELASVRLGHLRRSARLLPVPFTARVSMPAGATGLRLWLAPASTAGVPPACTVQWQLDWTAGDRWRAQEPLTQAGRAQAWRGVELKGRNRGGPTELEISATVEPSCSQSRALTAVSQIVVDGPARRSARPNLLLVVFDALRRDRMDCGPTSERLTPVLTDRLCRRGVFFSEAISPSSWTYPAIASIHTGLLPYQHGAYRQGAGPRDVDAHVATLAEVLQWNGYATIGFVPNPYAARGLWRGFDSYAELFPGPGRLTSDMRRADSMVDALDLWLRTERSEPFFAFVLLIDVHEPVDAAAKVGQIPPSCTGVVPIPYGWEGLDKIAAPLTPAQTQRLRCRNDLYDAALRFADHHLGRLLSTLDELGLSDETAILVTSDHGEELLDHALAQRPGPDEKRERWGVDHGHTMYQELLRVPLLLVPPAKVDFTPSRQPGLVSLVDLYATTLGLAGIPPPAGVATRDLLALLRRGEAIGQEEIVSQNTLYGQERIAVTTPALKAIRTGETVTVFDRTADEGEQTPLPPDHALVGAGRRLLDQIQSPQP